MRWLVTALVIAGCAAPATPEVPDAGDDEVRVDGAPICVPNATVCDDLIGIYVECDSEGVPAVAIECPLGCSSEVELCFDVVASNGLTMQLDEARDRSEVRSVTFSGMSTIDTDTGTARSGASVVPIPTTVVNGIRVLLFKYLTITGTVKVTGSLPLAIIADGDVEIMGLLDVSADLDVDGPGAITSGPCTGNEGGGGGHATPGAIAGAAYDGTMIGIAGIATPAPAIVPLHGGCRGGDGGGGGALQIVSRRTIAVTDGGRIDASGGGARSDASGGGAGGSLLLEAVDIAIVDGIVSTKGGSGSSARAAFGADGGTGNLAAQGGAVPGFASGGHGGTATAAPTAGSPGNATNPAGGGGGGAVGEARFNDRDGVVTVLGAGAIRSRYTEELVGSRLVP